MFRTLISVIIFLIIVTSTQAQQKDPVYFAAGSDGLNPFMAFFQNTRFMPVPRVSEDPHEYYRKQLELALIHFPVNKKISGLDIKGKNVILRITGRNLEADYYENVIMTDPPIKSLVLAASSPIALKYLVPSSIILLNQELKLLQNKAIEIWKKERQLFRENERPSMQITLQTPRIQGIMDLPDTVTVLFPAQFSQDKRIDDRGSFFFLFDRKNKKTLIGYFGHPEWSPDAPDTVVSITPRIYFKIGNSDIAYLLADYAYGWESSGLAIINLSKGQVEATTIY